MGDKSNCSKCGFVSEDNLRVFGTDICQICHCFSPNDSERFKQYISEKIPSNALDSFRKNFKPRGDPQKKGMIRKAAQGKVMSRAPFGYDIRGKKLVPAQNKDEVREIFEEFLQTSISLRKLSEKHGLSVNGLKKILRNFTYIGKIKFNGQIHNGDHEQILSSTLFNHVQNKLGRLQIKRA